MTNPLMEYATVRRWVNWKLESDSKGKPTKVPYRPDNRKASSTDPATWSTFTELHTNGFSGAGIVFTPDRLLLGVDGDHILSGDRITDDCFGRFVTAADTYAEVSQSGTGLHPFLTLTEPLDLAAHKRKFDDGRAYECYTTGRYFTVTFKPFADKPIRRVTPDEALRLLGILGYPWKKGPLTDDELLEHMFAARNGATARALYTGDTSAYGKDDSAADQAFVNRLVWWTNHDTARTERLWLRSKLGERDKVKDRQDYRARTIAAALGYITGGYTGNGAHEPDADVDMDRAPDDTPAPEEHGDILRKRPPTDVGNAECLATLYGDELKYCHTRGKWYAWDDRRWCEDVDGRAWRLMLATVRARQAQIPNVDDYLKKSFASFVVGSENEHKLNTGLSAASKLACFATTISLYDRDQMLANAGAVTLNLQTGTARANDPNDYITRRLGADYDAGATCPRWRRLLGEWFIHDAELIAYIGRAVGYSLTGDTREQKLFLCYGGGANGKSVFLTTLAHLMGDYAASRSFATFDADERNRVGDDLAGLKGTRLVTVIETNEDKRLNEARVKSLTGQDEINCRFLFGEYFSFRPEFKLWIAVNHKPTVRGTDRGIWRRIQLIPFLQNFEGHEDKTLDVQLQAELPGILNWALDGLRDWHKQGLNTPASVKQATEQYRAESDLLGQWVSACTVKGAQMETKAKDAYTSYKVYCEETNTRAISFTAFGNGVAERGIVKETRRTGVVYVGVGLVERD